MKIPRVHMSVKMKEKLLKSVLDETEDKKKTAAAIADTVLHKLAMSDAQREEFVRDVGNHLAVYGGQDASEIVPPGALRKRIEEISQGSSKQLQHGLLGAAGGAVSSAGLGMLAATLAGGKSQAGWGALSGLPGGLAGYGYYKDRQRRNELREALDKHTD
ncbi:MAG: hypothetical protein GY847_12275 [Proteobacteria bacterium]|nr:hypothetical protein [Pseudomonadota bacterium]